MPPRLRAKQVEAETPPGVPQPGPASPHASGGTLAELLQFEGEIRRKESVSELHYFLANEGRRIVAYDQLFILRDSSSGTGQQVVAVSSMATVDRNSPLIQALETGLKTALSAPEDKPDLAAAFAEVELGEYPYRAFHWQPFTLPDGTVFGGMLLARTRDFGDAETVRIERMAETASHAWRALSGGEPARKLRKPTRRETRALLIGFGLVMLLPVQMTAMAPVEVVASRPFVLAAPVEGVVSEIHVVPNAMVEEGQLLISFDDLSLRNDLQLAQEQVQIGRARAERANSEAFDDASRAREMAITRAELELAEAELVYAQDMFNQSRITAPRAGMAIYSDRRDWEGKAVRIGDPIMQLADPDDVAFRIDLPAKEQMALAPGNAVDIYLDAQPLWSIQGELETASYQARMTPEGILAFSLTARPLTEKPRIGSRGTAKVHGRWVPLGYSLFRRPIASLRQFIGF